MYELEKSEQSINQDISEQVDDEQVSTQPSPSQAPTLPLTTSTQQECPHSPGSCDKASHHPASLQASQMEDTQARKICHYRKLKPLLYPSYYNFSIVRHFCQTPVLGLGLGVDFTFPPRNKTTSTL